MRPVTDLERRVAPFEVDVRLPAVRRPADRDRRDRARINGGEKDVVLLGATGTGKTATVAWVVEQLQRPILVMQPNKTLAAQFANELRELLPEQRGRVLRLLLRLLPARGLRPADRHLHREGLLDQRGGRAAAALGDQLAADPARRDRGRRRCPASTASAPRRSTSTGCSGSRSARSIDRDSLLRRLVEIQYTRNDLAFTRGTFRVRGDTLEIFPVYEELAVRIEFFGDEIERLMTLHPLTGEVITEDKELYVFPATHYVAGPERMERAITRHRARARGPARRRSRSRASCSRRSGCGCARPTTSR